MDARKVTVDELGRVVVARTTLVDLIDRRDAAVGLFDLENRVRIAVAIDARGLAVVDAAAERPYGTAVALAAACLVRQRLHATFVALVDNVRMTFAALDVRVCRRSVNHVFMTGEAILQRLRISKSCDKQKPETEREFRPSDPGRGHIHCPDSLYEWV